MDDVRKVAVYIRVTAELLPALQHFAETGDLPLRERLER